MMKKVCETVTDTILKWENRGELSAKDFRRIKNHLDECHNCSIRYTGILPLIQHDVDNESTEKRRSAESSLLAAFYREELQPTNPDRAVADIMEKVAEEKNVRHEWRPAPIIAAAVGLVLVIGLALFGFRSGGTTSSTVVEAEGEDQVVEIHFSLSAPKADNVALVGDFTDWEISKINLKDPENDGVWEVQIKLEKDNVYLYNFVIDGEEWVVDPDSMVQVDDGFGGESSVLKL